MTKTFKNSIFFTAIILFSFCNISSASSTVLNSWPTKEKSARIIHNLYIHTQQELNTVERSTHAKLTRERVVYLKRLANALKNTDQDPEEVFKEIHDRHISQPNLTDDQKINYESLHDQIQEYVLTAGQ